MSRVLIILLLFVVSLSASQLTVNEQIRHNRPLDWFIVTGRIDTTVIDNKHLFVSFKDSMLLKMPVKTQLLGRENITLSGMISSTRMADPKKIVLPYGMESGDSTFSISSMEFQLSIDGVSPHYAKLESLKQKHTSLGITMFALTGGLYALTTYTFSQDSSNDETFIGPFFEAIAAITCYTVSTVPVFFGISQMRKADKARELMDVQQNSVSLSLNPLKKEIALVGEF